MKQVDELLENTHDCENPDDVFEFLESFTKRGGLTPIYFTSWDIYVTFSKKPITDKIRTKWIEELEGE